MDLLTAYRTVKLGQSLTGWQIFGLVNEAIAQARESGDKFVVEDYFHDGVVYRCGRESNLAVCTVWVVPRLAGLFDLDASYEEVVVMSDQRGPRAKASSATIYVDGFAFHFEEAYEKAVQSGSFPACPSLLG